MPAPWNETSVDLIKPLSPQFNHHHPQLLTVAIVAIVGVCLRVWIRSWLRIRKGVSFRRPEHRGCSSARFFHSSLTSSSFPSSHSHSRGSDRNGSHSSHSGGRPLRRLWLPSSSDPSRRKGSRSARSSGLAHSNCQDHSGLEMKILTPITLDWNIMNLVVSASVLTIGKEMSIGIGIGGWRSFSCSVSHWRCQCGTKKGTALKS